MSNPDAAMTQKQSHWLLGSAAGAFAAGLVGAIWHTQRKQFKENEALAPIQHQPLSQQPLPSQPLASRQLPSQTQMPTMTPAEYDMAKRDARFFAVKTLGYGTLLAFGGAGVLAVAIGYWLEVRNFQEFSNKLHKIVPEKTRRLRLWLGGRELVVTPQEEQEWTALEVGNDEA